MRQITAFATAAVLVLALTACSGGKSRNVPKVESSSSDCDFKQITTGARKEGSCVARGVDVTVVNKAHRLRGLEYDARILGLSTTQKLGGLRPSGTFVVVKLAVKNTTDAPHAYDRNSNLVFLLVDKRYFSEDTQAENLPRLGSFRRGTGALQPDETATGTIVFDVPDAHVSHLSQMGSNLILVNFSDAAKHFPTGTAPLKALGYIRLSK